MRVSRNVSGNSQAVGVNPETQRQVGLSQQVQDCTTANTCVGVIRAILELNVCTSSQKISGDRTDCRGRTRLNLHN